MLKLWDWLSGRLLNEIPIGEVIEPFIQVKPLKRRRTENDGEEGEGGESQNRGRRRGGRGKGKVKGKGQDTSREVSVVQEGGEGEGEHTRQQGEDAAPEMRDDAPEQPASSEAPERDAGAQVDAGAKAEPDPPVLVLHKIRSLDLGERGRYLVLSAVG